MLSRDELSAAGITDGESRRRLHDAGLTVLQVDCLIRWTAGTAAPQTIAEEREVFDAASAFGARIVSVIGPGNNTHSEVQLAERLAGVCDRGAERGFDIALEVSRRSAVATRKVLASLESASPAS